MGERGDRKIALVTGGNKGIGDGPPGSADIESVRRIIATNFLGTLAVTQAMLPLLRKAEAARIVNVSGARGSLTLHGDPDRQFAPYTFLGCNGRLR